MNASTDIKSKLRGSPGFGQTLLGKAGLVLGVAASFLYAPPPAAAQEFRFHAEGALALWVGEPQSDRFTPGFYFALRPALSLGRVVDLQWSYAMVTTSVGDGFVYDGAAHLLTAGVRLRPLAFVTAPEDQLGGLFVDFNLGYVRTGDLDRFGFDAGLGYNFQPTPWMALGPVVRYTHIVQPDTNASFDPSDAHLVTIGLNASFGPAYETPVELGCPAAPECVQRPPPPEPAQDPRLCLDRDGDGVCDDQDRCPTLAGVMKSFGCPTTDPCTGEPLVVLVQFQVDSAQLPPPQESNPQTMDPVLEAVASAIAQNKTCRVCIVGYASEEGASAYNLDLSQRRASAVQGYLAARGADPARMPTTGLGDRCQLAPENTRVLNRRVEFRRLGDGESCPTDCSR